MKLFPNTSFDGKECDACGLSIYLDLESAQKYIKRYPKRWKKIAQANLQTSHGKINMWRDWHATWWHYATVIPSTLFSIIS
jgi:hypothetical protein